VANISGSGRPWARRLPIRSQALRPHLAESGSSPCSTTCRQFRAIHFQPEPAATDQQQQAAGWENGCGKPSLPVSCPSAALHPRLGQGRGQAAAIGPYSGCGWDGGHALCFSRAQTRGAGREALPGRSSSSWRSPSVQTVLKSYGQLGLQVRRIPTPPIPTAQWRALNWRQQGEVLAQAEVAWPITSMAAHCEPADRAAFEKRRDWCCWCTDDPPESTLVEAIALALRSTTALEPPHPRQGPRGTPAHVAISGGLPQGATTSLPEKGRQ